jgi:hypothetical protein
MSDVAVEEEMVELLDTVALLNGPMMLAVALDVPVDSGATKLLDIVVLLKGPELVAVAFDIPVGRELNDVLKMEELDEDVELVVIFLGGSGNCLIIGGRVLVHSVRELIMFTPSKLNRT